MGSHGIASSSRQRAGLLAMTTLLLFGTTLRAFAEEISAYSRAVAAYDDRRLEEAFDYAKLAVREAPENPDAHFLLGELYYLRQDLTRAKESWEHALLLAPSRTDLRERLEKLQRETPVENGLARADTHPFVVRFAEEDGAVDLGDLRQLLRETYRLVGQSFDTFPDYPITVLLYPEEDFAKAEGLSHPAAGLFDGKIRLPLRKSVPGSPFSPSLELKRVLWHEYTHALVHDLSRGRCPVWLNEGIATLQEARVQRPQLTQLKKALDEGRVVSWDTLWSQQEYKEESLLLYYQQSYRIADYLVERFGWKGIKGLLERLSQGYPMADALRAQYKEEPNALEKEWLSWLKRGRF